MNFLDFLGFRVSDIEPMAKHRKRINDKRTANKCLLCEGVSHRRGLCSSDYWEYRLLILTTPLNRRHLVEAKLIRDGKLLANNQGRGGGRRRAKKAAG